MNRPLLGNNKILNAAVATGIGTPKFVGDYRHLELTLLGIGGADGTVKVKGSMQDTMPNFAAASTSTNKWAYVELKDLADGSTIDGDTGIVVTTNVTRQFEVNTNMLRWICPDITTYTAGQFYMDLDGANDSN